MLHTQPREGAYLSAYQPSAYLLSARPVSDPPHSRIAEYEKSTREVVREILAIRLGANGS